MNITTVILAAGMGKRMQSSLPKVLHTIAGATFLEILLATLPKALSKDVRLVVSEEVLSHALYSDLVKRFSFNSFIQHDKKGTADALKCAKEKAFDADAVLVLYGDSPLIQQETFNELYHQFINSDLDILCIAFDAKNPFGYGRLICEKGRVIAITEEKDLTDEQRSITLCNSGNYLIKSAVVNELLDKIEPNKITGEYYLTDIVELATKRGAKCSFIIAPEDEVLGINGMQQREHAEKIMQDRLRAKFSNAGVHFTDSSSVYISFDTEIGRGSYVEPFVYIGRKVRIAEDVKVLGFSHICGATIAKGASVGPFARIRPETIIGEDCRVGNFVELKETEMARGAKASHLSYIGDAELGEDTNVGAGTIFCNYDGYSKHSSIIGGGTFIGSNSSIVAPIKVGNDVIIGAGSVVTENIPDGTLTIARSRQTNYPQKAEVIKAKKKLENA